MLAIPRAYNKGKMVTEIELKYSLLEGKLNKSKELITEEQVTTTITQLLVTHQYAFIQQEKHLSNYYFDTADLALQKNKIALRTRGTQCSGEAVRFEQTIKTSGTVVAGLHQRPEYNVDIDDDKPILTLFPHTIWQENTNINQLQQDIIELFSTHFIRQTWLVSLDNAQVEIAFDAGEVACENYSVKPRIYEIELELVSGDAQALFVLTKLLFSQLALRPGQLTKAARGYALYRQRQDMLKHLTINSSSITNKNTAAQPDFSVNKRSNHCSLEQAFSEDIASSLTQLQHYVDSYVNEPSLIILQEIMSQLGLIKKGLRMFNALLTADDIVLENECSYFIETFTALENIVSPQALMNNEASDQATILDKQALTLLHSERFNRLQLDLLVLILSKKQTE